MNEKRFDTGKVVLNYFEGPRPDHVTQPQPPVVLLHGGSGNWQHLGALLEGLCPHWQVYAPDLRGHGKSGHVARGYTLRDYAEDTAAFLQQVSGPAFVFGHSLGGIVALMAAGTYPDLIKGVLVGDSPLDAATWEAVMQGPSRARNRDWITLAGGKFSVDEIIDRLKDADADELDPLTQTPLRMRDVYGEDHPVYRHLAERLYEHDPEVLEMILDDYAHVAEGFQMERLLPAIRCPVLLMQADPGAGGVMTDAEVTRGMALLSQPSLVRFPGLSHLLHIQDPETVLRAMEAFLTQCTQATPGIRI